MSRLFQDLKYAARNLKRSPAFLTVALLTLCVAMGANTAIFSVVRALLLKPFAYRDPDRIVLVWTASPRTNSTRGQVSASEIEDIKRQNTTLEHLATFSDWTPTLTGYGDAERIASTQVGDGFFDALGVKPLLGRFFTAEEQIEGKDNVVVLSYALWKNRFNGDPQIIGKAIRLSTIPHVVVGVLPASFRPLPSSLVDGGQLYRPVAEPFDPTKRGERHLRAIARLKPTVTIAQAQAELTQIAGRLAKEDPRENAGIGYSAVSLQEDSIGKLRTTIFLLCGSVLLLLMIACANVANLLLARSTVRQREFAIRSALGASRGQLIAQMLVESVLLALIAGVFGLLVAHWSTRGLALFGARVTSQFEQVHVDLGVTAFCFAAAVITGIISGLAPAIQLSKVSIADALKATSTHASSSRNALRNGLIVAEVAMAVVMLVSAGLLVRSFHRLWNSDPGFETNGRLSSNVWLPYSKYRQEDKQLPFFREMLARVQTLPGVKAAGIVSNPPMGNFDGRTFRVEGDLSPEGSLSDAQFYSVSAGYTRAMGIAQIAGRSFSEADTETSPAVVLINKKLADTRFPGQDPIGKHIQIQSGKKENAQYIWRTVVGVVGNVKQHGLDLPAVEQIYVPYTQFPLTWMTLVVDTNGDPLAMAAPVRSVVKELDADVAPFAVSSYDDIAGKTIASRTFALFLVSGFGVIALLLGVIGIYGVISYTVTQRTQEFGIRMALGASRGRILNAVLWQGLRLTLIGLIVGCVGAFLATQSLRSLLYEVQPTDLTTYFSIVLLLSLSAAAACMVPARRATQVDPMVALRYE
jgi:putative ABC transport system permease protein